MADQSQEDPNATTGENEAYELSDVPQNNLGDGADMTSSSHATVEKPDNDPSGDPTKALATRLKAIEDKMRELEGPEYDAESDSDDSDDVFGEYKTRFKLMKNMQYLVEESTRTLNSLSKLSKRRRKRAREVRDEGPDIEWEKRLNAMEAQCKEAIMQQEPANIFMVNWETFTDIGKRFEDFLMSPIQVINSEPDPHIVLSHANRASTADMRLGPLDLPPARISMERDPLPERIHLRSWHLEKALVKVVKYESLVAGQSTVLLRPYRVLVYYEKSFRDYTNLLKQDHERLKAAVLDNASESDLTPTERALEEASEELKPAEKQTLDYDSDVRSAKQASARHNVDHDAERASTNENSSLAVSQPFASFFHMRSLMTFFDNLVKPTIDHLTSDDCADVYYHDLWHLFKPGTEVIDQLGKQAYRVFRFQASRHKIEEAPWLRWSNTTYVNNGTDEEVEEQSPLRLSCVYIDFDGKSFGPVTKTFTISPFRGLQAVTKLSVYPLRLAVNRRLRSQLIRRGRMLLGMSKFKSMYYTGHTMDAREDIDSQVVVDFAEALTANEQWVPQFKGPEAAKAISRRYCNAPCCYGQPILDDEFVDAALAEDFIKTLVSPDTTNAPSLLLTTRRASDIQDGPKNEPTDEELVVMTHRVYAFVLRTRKWGKLRVHGSLGPYGLPCAK